MEHETVELPTGLQYHCPRCGAVEADDFDLLAVDCAYTVTCDSCQAQFSLEVEECQNCGQETAFTWTEEQAPGPESKLTCSSCGTRLFDHETAVRTVGDE